MQIIKAQPDNLNAIKQITHETISEVYHHYYAKGAVDYFLSHHSDEIIAKDIESGIVYLLMDAKEPIGTVTIRGNEICRLFVLPCHQHKGAGRQLLDFAEKAIAEEYSEIVLDSSLPAKRMYAKRGYAIVESHAITTENGDVLCYDVMKKNSNHGNTSINYDGRIFVPKVNTENGEVDRNTVFRYHQKENIIWAEYSGGDIRIGFLIGTVNSDGNLSFTYQHLNEAGQIRLGKCTSTPVLNGDKLELHETWQWLNGDESEGTSVISEI